MSLGWWGEGTGIWAAWSSAPQLSCGRQCFWKELLQRVSWYHSVETTKSSHAFIIWIHLTFFTEAIKVGFSVFCGVATAANSKENVKHPTWPYMTLWALPTLNPCLLLMPHHSYGEFPLCGQTGWLAPLSYLSHFLRRFKKFGWSTSKPKGIWLTVLWEVYTGFWNRFKPFSVDSHDFELHMSPNSYGCHIYKCRHPCMKAGSLQGNLLNSFLAPIPMNLWTPFAWPHPLFQWGLSLKDLARETQALQALLQFYCEVTPTQSGRLTTNAPTSGIFTLSQCKISVSHTEILSRGIRKCLCLLPVHTVVFLTSSKNMPE